jgi:hypothetical protein
MLPVRGAGVLADLASRSNSTVDLLLSAASHWAAERGSMNGALNAQAPVAEYGWVAAPASGGLAAGRLTGLATQPSFGTKRSMAKSGGSPRKCMPIFRVAMFCIVSGNHPHAP